MFRDSWQAWRRAFIVFRRDTSRPSHRRIRGFRPRLESLEDRSTPASVNLLPIADDTLYQVASPTSQQLSNGVGQHFYVGETAQGANAIRRGAAAFAAAASAARSRGSIASRNGNATTVPTPRSTVRLEIRPIMVFPRLRFASGRDRC